MNEMNKTNISDECNGPREDKQLPSFWEGRGVRLQLPLAILLVLFGVALITAAFIVPPPGVIDPTVLTAFGEILTFAGSLIGIDYHYRYKSGDYPP